MIEELLTEALDNPTPRMLKIIREAEEKGWTTGKISLAIRVTKPEDVPSPRIGMVKHAFYAVWELTGWTEKGRPSWHFTGARGTGGQALSEGDILTYMETPEVIFPDWSEDK